MDTLENRPFVLHSSFTPTGDQPDAIDELVANVEAGVRDQILLGVTGSGKTFTMANVIARTGRPAFPPIPDAPAGKSRHPAHTPR